MKALEIAIHIKMGAQKINQNLNTNAQSVKFVNNSQGRSRTKSYQQQRKDCTRYPTVHQNYQYTSVCANCDRRWRHNQKQICPERGKKCNNYGILGNFAKKSRKAKKCHPQSSQSQQTNVTQFEIRTTTTKSDDEESVKYITSYQQLYHQVFGSNYDSDFDYYVAVISSDVANQLRPLNAKIHNGKIFANSMIKSGNVCSIIIKPWRLEFSKVHHLHVGSSIITKRDKDLKTFSNEPIKVLGKIATTVAYKDWKCENASLAVVEDGHKFIIGRDLCSSLGLAVVQQQAKRGKCGNNIDNSICKVKQTIASKFPNLVSLIGLSRTHVVKSKFHQKYTAKHQKVRLVPINIQLRVTIELDCLKQKEHTEKLSSCSDENFISSIVTTVKKDQSIK